MYVHLQQLQSMYKIFVKKLRKLYLIISLKNTVQTIEFLILKRERERDNHNLLVFLFFIFQ